MPTEIIIGFAVMMLIPCFIGIQYLVDNRSKVKHRSDAEIVYWKNVICNETVLTKE